ncbi:hypothetical protein C1645_803836 [Glomus cerebriforme]|uniref:Uncharacterized protein n=1 Tax=Glomus cerebriforme TaxID=658196 RepID=A0A397TBR5_9GLOM|nr:hypothetical protein C1645_803836 [Glomus cerebriforme]
MADYDTPMEEEGVVKDEFYVQNVEHGGDEYDPQQDLDEEETEYEDKNLVNEDINELNPDKTMLPQKLRNSTYDIAQSQGYYNEGDETESDVTGGEIQGGKDASKQLSSLIAASHRKGRTPEKKRESALKASELHEQITGHPLEINNEGEVLTGARISSG